MSAVAPRSPAPAKKLSEVDFRSGATLEQLSAQVSELVLLEQGEFGDQTALEVHTAKDFIFNMLGMSANKSHLFNMPCTTDISTLFLFYQNQKKTQFQNWCEICYCKLLLEL